MTHSTTTSSSAQGAARAEAPAGERIALPGDKSPETLAAVRLANRVLDLPGIDPDGDVAVLARQLLRTRERFAAVLAPAPAAGGVVPEGYALVPVEPTKEMRAAFHVAHEQWEHGSGLDSPDHQWAALLAAAPTPRAAPEARLDLTPTTPSDVVEAARWVADAFATTPPEPGAVSVKARTAINVLRTRLDGLDPAPAAPGAGVDLAGMEAAVAAHRAAVEKFRDWGLKGSMRDDVEARYEADRKAADDAGAAVLDAVRALVKPSGEIGDLIDKLTSCAHRNGWYGHPTNPNDEGYIDEGVADTRARLDAAIAALGRDAAGRGGGAGQRWRHIKRGTIYEEVGRAELQSSDVFSDPSEGDDLVIYRGEDGKLWARLDREFEDGRFVRIAAEDRDRGADGREG